MRRKRMSALGTERVVERLHSFFLQVDVTRIVIHKANQPNSLFDFFDSKGLAREDRAEINFLRCRQMRPQQVTWMVLS